MCHAEEGRMLNVRTDRISIPFYTNLVQWFAVTVGNFPNRGRKWCRSSCPTLFKCLFFLLILPSVFLFPQRREDEIQATKQQSSWVQLAHCSTGQSHQRPPAAGLHGSLGAAPSRQSLIRLCLGGPCAWCLSRRSCPEMGNTTWEGSCCLEDEGVCGEGEMWQDSCAVSAWHRAGSQGCHHGPTQMRSEVPTVLC